MTSSGSNFNGLDQASMQYRLQQLDVQKMKKTAAASDDKLMKAAKDFESVFTNMVMQKMRDMVPESDVFGSKKVKFFESMLFEEYSKTSAATQGLGLAEKIYEQLSRTQSLQGEKNED